MLLYNGWELRDVCLRVALAVDQKALVQGLRSAKPSFCLRREATSANSSSCRPILNFSDTFLFSQRQGSQSRPHSGYSKVSFISTRCSMNSESSSVQAKGQVSRFLRYSSTLAPASSRQLLPFTTSRVVFSVSSEWMAASSCISSKCSCRTSRSRGVTVRRNLPGLPAQISPSFTSALSGMTAPAATKPPEWTVAWRTVAPMDTKARFSRVEPWRMALGPTKTLSPTTALRETWTRSWMTELLPMRMGVVPRMVAPYQIEELVPTTTSPRTVALGATKVVSSRQGSLPSQASRRRLGVTRSSLSPSPSSLFPTSQRRLPAVRRAGPSTFSLRLLRISQITTLIKQLLRKLNTIAITRHLHTATSTFNPCQQYSLVRQTTHISQVLLGSQDNLILMRGPA